jgi:hypothetical protein
MLQSRSDAVVARMRRPVEVVPNGFTCIAVAVVERMKLENSTSGGGSVEFTRRR